MEDGGKGDAIDAVDGQAYKGKDKKKKTLGTPTDKTPAGRGITAALLLNNKGKRKENAMEGVN